MLLDEPLPPQEEMLRRFAEKKIILMLAINSLDAMQVSGQDSGYDIFVRLPDSTGIYIETKWCESADAARHYLREYAENMSEASPSAVSLAVVIGEGEEVVVDAELQELLKIVPEDTGLRPISEMLQPKSRLFGPG